jgi:hypothetical protein
MTSKVIIDVSNTRGKKRVFSFEEHDTFMVGRMGDCHVCIEDDDYLSRRHFILEVNPPQVRLQDLGSLNGTYINGNKVGGRDANETPEEAIARHKFPWIDLKNGDVIKTGDTCFNLLIQSPDLVSKPVKCQKCGRDVSTEAGAARGGTYICEGCRKNAEASPFQLLQQFLEEPRSFHIAQSNKNIVSTHIRGFQMDYPVDFSDFDVIKVLGSGIFGASYHLKHRANGQEMVLKLMLPKIAANKDLQNRFLEDTKEVRGLSHTNTVDYFESGCRNGIFYFLSEYCNFGNMDSLRRGGKVPPQDTVMSALQVLEALTKAHSEGHVHRDLKPQNILLQRVDRSLTAKLSDFGLARSFIITGLSGLTVTGENTGAYPYMPREQVVDFKYSRPETDIWALGATMYNLITGEFPRDFSHGRDPLEVILHGEIVPIRKREASIHEELAEIIDHSVQNEPEDRYQHAGEMLSALKRFLKKAR